MNRKKRVATALDFSGEVGARLYALMEIHNIHMGVGFRDGQFQIQVGNTEVSTEHCLTIARCSEGRKAQYVVEAEDGR